MNGLDIALIALFTALSSGAHAKGAGNEAAASTPVPAVAAEAALAPNAPTLRVRARRHVAAPEQAPAPASR